MPATKPTGQAHTRKTAFSRETAVETDIRASPSTVWDLLTRAEDYPEWNSTIISLEGKIAPGEQLRLRSTLDPKRTFKLRVLELVPNEKLVWGDGNGRRTFLLNDRGNGTTYFEMHERIGGLLFPLYGRFIPPFDESFEQFAADLKRAAEASGSSPSTSAVQ